MKQIFILISFLTVFCFSRAQSNFPTTWIGSYEGNLLMEFPDGIKDTIPVTFDLLPTAEKNRWTYRVSYFSKKWGNMVKDYELFWNDSLKSPNHFILDEKDGILIDEVFMNNRFMATFETGGDVFVSLLEKTTKGLYMEIRCTSPLKGIASISLPDSEGNSYKVKSNYTYTVQYAYLTRKK